MAMAVLEREVVRCPSCRLRQFMTRSENCRRCAKPLRIPPPVVPVVEAPKPVRTFTPIAYVPGIAGGMAQALRVLRLVHGLSQRDFAAKLACARTHISKLECGCNVPVLKQIERMAVALEVSPRLLVLTAMELGGMLE